VIVPAARLAAQRALLTRTPVGGVVVAALAVVQAHRALVTMPAASAPALRLLIICRWKASGKAVRALKAALPEAPPSQDAVLSQYH
jgi:hypothetical protein